MIVYIMKVQEPVYVRAPDIPLYAKATSLRPIASWTTQAPLAARLIRYYPWQGFRYHEVGPRAHRVARSLR